MEKAAPRKLKAGEEIKPVLSAAQLDLIAQVIVNWSRLEAALESTIWYFLRLDEDDGRVITSRLGADAKLKILGPLGGRYIQNSKILTKYKRVLAKAGELAADRAFIAHGVWFTLTPKNIPVAMSLRPKSRSGEVIGEEFPDSRMRNIILHIQTATQMLDGLPAALATLRDKGQSPSA
jgi:hypothetical protein